MPRPPPATEREWARRPRMHAQIAPDAGARRYPWMPGRDRYLSGQLRLADAVGQVLQGAVEVIRPAWPAAVMRSPSSDPRTQPVPSMWAWADGSASTANTVSGAASIVVDALTFSVSIPVRLLAGSEFIAARDSGRSRIARSLVS